ncbi:MAG TPA: hypothetical protein VKP69_23865, partial [Isosphaeraceae bacterium]|nr:hypothetical protein [Isosphaeraceae bacterium]
LVARTLEQRWEEALRGVRQVDEEYERFVNASPPRLSVADRDRIRALAADIPALWHAPETAAADRKEVIRCLVERVVVTVAPDSEQVGVSIHWQGGFLGSSVLKCEAVGFLGLWPGCLPVLSSWSGPRWSLGRHPDQLPRPQQDRHRGQRDDRGGLAPRRGDHRV